jgi:hypothetical protein
MPDAKSILLIDGNDKDRQYYAHRLRVGFPDNVVFEALTGHAGVDLTLPLSFSKPWRPFNGMKRKTCGELSLRLRANIHLSQ